VSLLRHLACLVVGAAVALAAVLVHRSVFPLGLLLALATSFAVPWWLLGSTRPRTAASYVVGWLVVLGLVLDGRPEGDYALAGDLEGYTMLGAGFLLLVIGIVSIAGRRRPGA
jgi:Family of unknown function (DUF6113)